MYATLLICANIDSQFSFTLISKQLADSTISLRAAVCKCRKICRQNGNFEILHIQSEKNPLVKHFRKSQSKFKKKFLFRENRQKVKCCPTPYSRRSKTFELYHFQSPREERRFKEKSSSLAGKIRLEGYCANLRRKYILLET